MRNGIVLLLILFSSVVMAYFLLSKPATYSFLLPKNDFRTSIDNILANTDGEYGIYIKNLKTGETYTKGEHQAFEPGSLYKIWVMGAVFEKVREGKIKLDDEISANVAELNKEFEIDKEDAELTEGILNFSISSAIEQMITISHNYAAMVLTKKVGRANITSFMKNYGLLESSLGPPLKSSAYDLGNLFEKLYKGEVVNAEYSEKMLDILSRQKISDRIPKYLPAGTKVAHKTGDLGYFENDAGIVYAPKGDFIIVVLSETKHPDEAGDKIGRISEAAYKYFNK